jgi:hypothetical protein
MKATTKCKKDMSCLNKDSKNLCKVDHRVGNEVYLYECRSGKPCSYRESFKVGIYCSCPIRIELFKKYSV